MTPNLPWVSVPIQIVFSFKYGHYSSPSQLEYYYCFPVLDSIDWGGTLPCKSYFKLPEGIICWSGSPMPYSVENPLWFGSVGVLCLSPLNWLSFKNIAPDFNIWFDSVIIHLPTGLIVGIGAFRCVCSHPAHACLHPSHQLICWFYWWCCASVFTVSGWVYESLCPVTLVLHKSLSIPSPSFASRYIMV